MSLIEEGETKQVRMANLAIVGSHSINGVSALHSDLVKSNLVPDFHQLWPHRFNNKTNGITQRRWLLVSNPALSSLVTEVVGDGWIRDLRELRGLESVASDPEFQNRFNAVKRSNKERLTEIIAETTGVSVDPDSIFDIQAKRIHEYKRQLLMVMYVIHEYLNLVEDGIEPIAPRTFLIAGKAAPGYWAAKQMIKLVNNVGQIVNNDLRTRDLLKVIFIPDYKVSLAERIIPSANLSEQISTAGKEASGTGNMKFALNGALTIGTLDGANIEICDEVGEENIYIFGLKAHEIQELQLSGRHDPAALYRGDPMLRRVMDCFKTNRFSSHEPELFEWIFTNLVERDDPFFHLADFSSYVETQKAVSSEYLNFPLWTRKAILNVARIGKFSSDRTIHEYAEKIWNVKPCPAGS